jgi:hypothetical protein
MKQGTGFISDTNMQKMQTISRNVTVSSEVAGNSELSNSLYKHHVLALTRWIFLCHWLPQENIHNYILLFCCYN